MSFSDRLTRNKLLNDTYGLNGRLIRKNINSLINENLWRYERLVVALFIDSLFPSINSHLNGEFQPLFTDSPSRGIFSLRSLYLFLVVPGTVVHSLSEVVVDIWLLSRQWRWWRSG